MSWKQVLLASWIGLCGGVALFFAVNALAPQPRPDPRYTPAGEWVRDDIQLGNAVVHRGRVTCSLDYCSEGQYGYWRLYSAGLPPHEKARFECGCTKEGTAPPRSIIADPAGHCIREARRLGLSEAAVMNGEPVLVPGRALSAQELAEATQLLLWCAENAAPYPPRFLRRVFRARTFDPPSPECGRSATCAGIERLYCEGPYEPWCGAEVELESKHERDSSNDVHRCPKCGWTCGEMELWPEGDR